MTLTLRILVLILCALLLLPGCSGDNGLPFDPGDCIPDRIVDARIAYADSTGEACLTWTAPDYCRKSDTVDRYEIRYQYDGPFDWETARSVIDPPLALAPGERQIYRFRYPDRGRMLFVAISSAGASGKPSRPSNTAVLMVPGFRFTGTCRNVYTKAPLAGIGVVLQTADTSFVRTTDTNGVFVVDNFAFQSLTVWIRFDPYDPDYFNLSQQFFLSDDMSCTFFLIPHRMSEVLPSVSLLTLFKTASAYSGPVQTNVLMTWNLRPVRTWIPPFVSQAGIDYGTLARSAVQRWMDRTGYELFEFVDAPPDTGVVFHYLPRSEMGALNGITRHTYGADGLPLRDDIQVADDLADSTFVYRVLLHETGHTLQFKHLSSPRFIMYYGQPLPPDISDDEVWLVRLLESLPNRTDLSIYAEVEAE